MVKAMREPAFWVLTALASESRHGHGVIREVARLSGDAMRLPAGTLFSALDRLGAAGLVGLDRDEIVDGRTRPYYRLTETGAVALDAERVRRTARVRTASRALAVRPGQERTA